jgi:hypothetical protein
MQEGYVPCTRCLRQYLKTSVSGKPGVDVADGVGDADEEREELASETRAASR